MENKLGFFFKHQIWHLGGTIILFYIGAQLVDLKSNTSTFIGISALGWFMIAMSIPIIHQAYVWVCWRSELCWQTISKTIGFKAYAIIFFTGATAGVKGFANSSAFAMGKFGLRGLAQSLARELHPKNIHIGHFVIDGGIGKKQIGDYQMINPDEIAKTYLDFYNQDKSAWSWEIELRTSVEKF